MYLCCHTKGMKKYAIGNLKEQSFDEIWNSAHRRHVYENIDYRDCALPCREAANNRLLIGLLQDVTHVNFLS
jgi:radical SAM protein with 4Fe4S-binding SPASM domain